jgi:hypothetical protein
MAVDGKWNIAIDTPMGTRQAELELKADGSALSGTQSADGQSGPIQDGSVDGNKVSWKVDITNPMPLTLTFTGNVDGEKISGDADTGTFGSFPFSGSRA